MPKYHFDLIDSKTVADEGGQILADDTIAMNVAKEIARRLLTERPELTDRHYSILVSNEDGEEVGRVPLDIIH
jgi:hypothetical protein